MKTAIIFNPVGGKGKSLKLLPRVYKWLDKKKIRFDFFTTKGIGDAYNVARLCVLEQYKRIIVIGGDGTINETGSALLGTDLIMGIIPGGTGNDFYKMLGNNGNFADICKNAFLGNPHEIDVGLVNDKPFINAVGIGFDAEVAIRAYENPGSGGIMVYLRAVMQTLRNLQPIDIEVELDGYTFAREATLVCIGNGRSSGGGFFLTPHAKFDDGLFDICFIDAIPKSKLIRYLPRTLNGSHVRLDGATIYRGKKLVIKSFRKLPVHIDGEPYKEFNEEIFFNFDKRKLLIAMPEKPN